MPESEAQLNDSCFGSCGDDQTVPYPIIDQTRRGLLRGALGLTGAAVVAPGTAATPQSRRGTLAIEAGWVLVPEPGERGIGLLQGATIMIDGAEIIEVRRGRPRGRMQRRHPVTPFATFGP